MSLTIRDAQTECDRIIRDLAETATLRGAGEAAMFAGDHVERLLDNPRDEVARTLFWVLVYAERSGIDAAAALAHHLAVRRGKARQTEWDARQRVARMPVAPAAGADLTPTAGMELEREIAGAVESDRLEGLR